MGSKFFVVNPGTMPNDGDLCFVAKASSDYGGFTIIDAYAVTGIVGTLDLVLMNYGVSGTVAGGTAGNMASGTATVWAAAAPQQLTLSTTAANLYFDANEWLVVKKLEAASGNDLAAKASIVIEYVDGVVDAG